MFSVSYADRIKADVGHFFGNENIFFLLSQLNVLYHRIRKPFVEFQNQ